MISAMMQPVHVFGWLVVLYSSLPLLLSLRFLRGSHLGLGFFLVVGAHHFVAIVNTFVMTLPDAGGDAERFHGRALQIARGLRELEFVTGSEGYDNFLGLIYTTFGSSRFLGSEVSIFAFMLSCILFIKLMDTLGIEYRLGTFLVSGLLPTLLIHTSNTMREAWEILFFMAVIYFGLRYHIHRQWRYIFYSVFAGMLLGMLHAGLAVVVLFSLPIILFWPIGHRSWARAFMTRPKAIFACCMLVMAVSVGLAEKANLGYVGSLLQGEILHEATGNRDNRMNTGARTNVEADLETDTVHGFSGSIGIIFIHYMLEPFPWRVQNALDVYAACEGYWRVLLLLCSVLAIRRAQGPMRQIMELLLLLYITMSVMWAVGTVNYGSALRHHVVGYWIIVLLGFPEFMRRMRVFLFMLISRQRQLSFSIIERS
tara:strand:+ start:3663 stop:4940 length:1278 start_codon:yes stop_codon:yes gene_type:complete